MTNGGHSLDSLENYFEFEKRTEGGIWNLGLDGESGWVIADFNQRLQRINLQFISDSLYMLEPIREMDPF